MERQPPPHVLMIPVPGQGHVGPLMKLAHRIADHGIKVTFVNTDFIHARLLQAQAGAGAGAEARSPMIRLVSVSDGLDPSDDRKDFAKLAESINRVMPGHLKDLIKKVSSCGRVSCVISDIAFQRWPMEVAEEMGIDWVPFCPFGPQSFTVALHIPKLIEAKIVNSTDGSPLSDEMMSISDDGPELSSKGLPWVWPSDINVQQRLFRYYFELNRTAALSKWLLCNTFHQLDSYSCDLIPNILPIGPLQLLDSNINHPDDHDHDHDHHHAGKFWREDSTCISWLDQQPVGSVVYVAFGSIAVSSQRQFSELALALELAGRPFLWVVRSDFVRGSAAEYHDGFIERVGERGKIVSWAPQEEVLAHPSVACFLSHCGWNSTIDGISRGVPFLCWPCFNDQFINETYICNKWKVGLELKADEDDGFISMHEIKDKIQKLVSDEGIKANARKLQEIARKSVGEGGSSYNNFKTFIEAIKQY